MTSPLYIGLMSGTSLDGLDAVLVDLTSSPGKLINSAHLPYTDSLRHQLHTLCHATHYDVHLLAQADQDIGLLSAQLINNLLSNAKIESTEIEAIGSHGQTIRHYPQLGFTHQIGDPNIIVESTGITTVADFRRRDIAAGGEGAPLVPAYHAYALSHPDTTRYIVNIGGMANVTVLPPLTKATEFNVQGFDTGPGNVLLDEWCRQHLSLHFDKDGQWASSGNPIPELLNHFLQDPYFKTPPPKSTGREYFNTSWLNQHLHDFSQYSANDVQATLIFLTVKSIINAIEQFGIGSGDIFICGGGAYNSFLLEIFSQALPNGYQMYTTDEQGIPANWLEAIAFAWLAKQTLNHKTGNIPSVTNAKGPRILGAIYYP
ncbi:anhydro-N-acetylmuramic acid kinase [Zooshikella sp. RANM57]|uniref:anhydro-N-acetylmuramic acid kinase n=1 Tax=Zooshikella sp. RANM57 TaxID=3425863 RepID=UPI003D6E7823